MDKGIIKKAWITERAVTLSEKGKYIFVIDRKANKTEAVKAIEEAGGVQKGQEIAMLDAQIGAAKAHQEGILKSIELMTKVNQGENNGTNGTGVPGMEGTPRN